MHHHPRKNSFHDFMTNDNNPDLIRMANQLLKDPLFLDILKKSGYNPSNPRKKETP